ncbi:MAG: thioredoxin family protein [Candidatus Pseudobacter hemicellulosilyticus]|uniref:Thioredoxin family protein n=1 Tax=Candidatus Pseudobacter hemicellulosilyticus TaxID=3121375 RepID=A0AAJ5WWR7_9BACT|nr:MAG: thioredoxin family protein [Pseudobacter sp.]
MRSKTLLFLPVLLLVVAGAFAQTAPPSADDVLKEATKTAAKEKKQVFVIFHASWCGWCHKMDEAMNDPAVKPYFDKNYVVRHLVVMEAKEKKDLENPGATEFMAKYHGDNQGIPFWLIFDKKGKLVADSQLRPEGAGLDQPGQNTGCPATPEEIGHFLKVLKQTSKLNDEEISAIEKRFKAIRG